MVLQRFLSHKAIKEVELLIKLMSSFIFCEHFFNISLCCWPFDCDSLTIYFNETFPAKYYVNIVFIYNVKILFIFQTFHPISNSSIWRRRAVTVTTGRARSPAVAVHARARWRRQLRARAPHRTRTRRTNRTQSARTRNNSNSTRLSSDRVPTRPRRRAKRLRCPATRSRTPANPVSLIPLFYETFREKGVRNS